MNAEQLAEKFRQKISAAVVEKERQTIIAAENKDKRTADIEHCKQAMEREVIPFLEELKHHFGEEQFSFAPQIERNDHRPVGCFFYRGQRCTDQHLNCIRQHRCNSHRRVSLLFLPLMSSPTFPTPVI